MDEFWKQIVTFLIAGGGGFGVAAAVEGAVIWRLFDLLVKSYEQRITDRASYAETLAKAMENRTAEYERLATVLNNRGRRT